ncbi:MAG: SOS-response transcriptional repressor, LexA [Gemmataceae bacterium]|nr:SOS-response transcriptional repressor, LexA [Gemmataceae bacterium]
MSREITHRQKEIYLFIRDHIVTNGYAPAVRAIAREFGVTPNAIHYHMIALRKKHYLRASGTVYVPAVPEVVIERKVGGLVSIATTGPVMMGEDQVAKLLGRLTEIQGGAS